MSAQSVLTWELGNGDMRWSSIKLMAELMGIEPSRLATLLSRWEKSQTTARAARRHNGTAL